MNTIAKNIICMLFLMVIPFSNFYSQEICNAYLLYEYPVSILKKNPLQINEINLLTHFICFHNSSVPTIIGDKAIIDSILTNNVSNSKSKQTYNYDAYKRILSYKILYWQNKMWVNGWFITNQYDSLGNKISTLSEFWNGANWESYILENNLFDDDGNNTLQLHEFWKNNKWTNILRISNTFDANGNLLTLITESWSDSL
ncbi:MAG: hypothetical protein P8X73_06800 [Ignavibacteriaceae bacterium]